MPLPQNVATAELERRKRQRNPKDPSGMSREQLVGGLDSALSSYGGSRDPLQLDHPTVPGAALSQLDAWNLHRANRRETAYGQFMNAPQVEVGQQDRSLYTLPPDPDLDRLRLIAQAKARATNPTPPPQAPAPAHGQPLPPSQAAGTPATMPVGVVPATAVAMPAFGTTQGAPTQAPAVQANAMPDYLPDAAATQGVADFLAQVRAGADRTVAGIVEQNTEKAAQAQHDRTIEEIGQQNTARQAQHDAAMRVAQARIVANQSAFPNAVNQPGTALPPEQRVAEGAQRLAIQRGGAAGIPLTIDPRNPSVTAQQMRGMGLPYQYASARPQPRQVSDEEMARYGHSPTPTMERRQELSADLVARTKAGDPSVKSPYSSMAEYLAKTRGNVAPNGRTFGEIRDEGNAIIRAREAARRQRQDSFFETRRPYESINQWQNRREEAAKPERAAAAQREHELNLTRTAGDAKVRAAEAGARPADSGKLTARESKLVDVLKGQLAARDRLLNNTKDKLYGLDTTALKQERDELQRQLYEILGTPTTQGAGGGGYQPVNTAEHMRQLQRQMDTTPNPQDVGPQISHADPNFGLRPGDAGFRPPLGSQAGTDNVTGRKVWKLPDGTVVYEDGTPVL